MSISPDSQSFSPNKDHVVPTVDSEREEYRKYLESSGVLDVLTHVMDDLYEKEVRPTDPLSYITEALGTVNFYVVEHSALKEELHDLRVVLKNLEEENRFLKKQLEKVVPEAEI